MCSAWLRFGSVERSHSQAESEHLLKLGASKVIMGEEEIAKAMIGAMGGAKTVS